MWEVEKSLNCSICGKEFILKSALKAHELKHSKGNVANECSVCGRIFALHSSLQTHMLKHVPKTLYDCSVCGMVFKEKHNFKQHLETHSTESKSNDLKEKSMSKNKNPKSRRLGSSGSNQFKCGICYKMFQEKTNYDTHMLEHPKEIKLPLVAEEKIPTRCIPCKQVFPSEELLKNHIDQQLYECEICRVSFLSCADLKFHSKQHAPPKVVECEVCGEKFHNAKKLYRHKLVHTGEERCSVCQKQLKNKLALRDHMYKMHSVDQQAPCNICGKVYDKHYIKTHMRIHVKKEEAFKCEHCGLSFKHQNYLTLHMKRHTHPKRLDCEVCGKVFSCRKNLSNHKEIHTKEKECSVCQKMLRNQRCLRQHMREKHMNGFDCKVQCDICGNMYHKQYLKTHINIHLGIKDFTCSICGKKFVARLNLWNHMKSHRGEKNYKCNYCHKMLSSRNGLKVHYKTHTGEKPHKCDQCPFAAIRLFQLKDHKRIHTNEKPYQCQLCGKKFAHKRNIKPHYTTHSQEDLQKLDPEILKKCLSNSFDCTVCGKTFYQKSLLTIHTRIHTGEKPHKCAVCGKSFRLKVLVRAHLQSHNGEQRPYQCDLCDKRFKHHISKRKHMNLHNEKIYKCALCGKTFAFKNKLMLHLKTHSEGEFIGSPQSISNIFICTVCGQEFILKCEYDLHQKSCLCEMVTCSETVVTEIYDANHFTGSIVEENYDTKERTSLVQVNQSECNVHTIECLDDVPLDMDIQSARTQVIFKLSEDSESLEEGILVQKVEHTLF